MTAPHKIVLIAISGNSYPLCKPYADERFQADMDLQAELRPLDDTIKAANEKFECLAKEADLIQERLDALTSQMSGLTDLIDATEEERDKVIDRFDEQEDLLNQSFLSTFQTNHPDDRVAGLINDDARTFTIDARYFDVFDVLYVTELTENTDQISDGSNSDFDEWVNNIDKDD